MSTTGPPPTGGSPGGIGGPGQPQNSEEQILQAIGEFAKPAIAAALREQWQLGQLAMQGQYAAQQRRDEAGIMGRFWGTKHPNVHIAAVCAFLLLGMVGYVLYHTMPTHDWDGFKNVGFPLLAAFGTVIGYIFGKLT